MNSKWFGRLAAMSACVAVCCSSTVAHAAVIDFDGIPATCCFAGVTPGGARGPVLVFPDVTLDGGVVMSDDGWAGGATTKSNLYGTSDFSTLSDDSSLPGIISGTFSNTVSSIDLDVINGFGASMFTLNAYDASDTLLTSSTVSLNAFSTAGFVGPATVSASGIKKFTVTSAQIEEGIDFAIDTLEYNVEQPGSGRDNVVPEPASFVLLGLGGLGAFGARKRWQIAA